MSRDAANEARGCHFLAKMERTQRLKTRPVGPASLRKRSKLEVKLVDIGRCECSDPSCKLRHHDPPVFSPPTSPSHSLECVDGTEDGPEEKELVIGRDAKNRGKSVFEEDNLTRERLEMILSARCCSIHPDGSIKEIDLSSGTCITPAVARRLLGQPEELEEGEVDTEVFPLDVDRVMNNVTRYKNSPEAIAELRSRIGKKSIFFPSRSFYASSVVDFTLDYGTIRDLFETYVFHFVVVCDTELLAM